MEASCIAWMKGSNCSQMDIQDQIQLQWLHLEAQISFSLQRGTLSSMVPTLQKHTHWLFMWK